MQTAKKKHVVCMYLMYVFCQKLLPRCNQNVYITGVLLTATQADMSELTWLPVIFAMTLAYLSQPAFWDFHTQERVCDTQQQIPPLKK